MSTRIARDLRLSLAPLALLFAGPLLVACSGDDDGGGGGGTTHLISLSADGTPYETPTTGAIRNADGTFTFAAEFDTDRGIGVSLTAPLMTGTFTAGMDKPVFATFNSEDNSFAAGGTRGSGDFTVDSIDGDLVTGAFAFEAVSVDGTNTPISITDGAFEVVITVKN